MSAFYNEIEPFAASWLSNLMAAGEIAPGRVDTRSIADVGPDDLAGVRRAHFFAGIGGWDYALRLAGWPDDAEVWTGSCPCQPFSAAGKRKGFDDARHLWPEFARLIRACRPATVMGEQVAGPDGMRWLDALCDDLEDSGYTVRACVLGGPVVGAPHIRHRIYWRADRVADTNCLCAAGGGVEAGRGLVATVACSEAHRGPFGLADRLGAGLEGLGRHGDDRGQPGRVGAQPAGSVAAGGDAGWVAVQFAADCDPDGDGWCRLRDCDPAECDCIGPTEEGVEYAERNGVLFGRRLAQPHGRQRHGQPEHDGDERYGPARGRDQGHGEPAGLGRDGGLADADQGQRGRLAAGEGRQRDGAAPGREQGDRGAPGGGDARGLGDAHAAGSSWFAERDGEQVGRREAVSGGLDADGSCDHSRPGPPYGFWRDADWLYCRDGKWRPVEPGTFPLLDGVSECLARLRSIETYAIGVLINYGYARDGDATQGVRMVRSALREKARWDAPRTGVREQLHASALLFDFLLCAEATCDGASERSGFEKAGAEVRQRIVRSVRNDGWPDGSSHQRRSDEQLCGEPANALSAVSLILARLAEAHRAEARKAHAASGRLGALRGAGNAIIPQVAAAFIAATSDPAPAGCAPGASGHSSLRLDPGASSLSASGAFPDGGRHG